MKKCRLNKNHVLSLYFREGPEKKDRETRAHIDGCPECRDYLATLEKTGRALAYWQDEPAPEKAWDTILADLPEKQPAPVQASPAVPVMPVVWIGAAVTFLLAVIILLGNHISLLPIWDTLKETWLVKFLGPLGTAALLVFLLGIALTLALAPVLILDSEAKKYRFYYG